MTAPAIRLTIRSLLVMATVFSTQVQQGTGWLKAAIEGFVSGAVLAGFELSTPLNPTVGVGK